MGEEERKGDYSAFLGPCHLWLGCMALPVTRSFDLGGSLMDDQKPAVGSTPGLAGVAMTSFVPTSLRSLACVCTWSCM